LEVIAGQAHSYCSDAAQAEPASVVEPVDVAAGVTGRLGNPTSSRPTNSQCHRHRVLTRTAAGTTAPPGFRLRDREPARGKRVESLSMTRARPDVRHRPGTRRDQSRCSGATRSHQLMDSPSVAIRSFNSTVTRTVRKPTTPNHNQLTYASTRLGPTSSIEKRPLPCGSTRHVWTTAGVCRANVSPFACSEFENPVPTGRYGRDGDAVW
jgi:hypothetical protein